MSNYRVNLEIFAGPMDLLLYLVRKEEVSKITDQYIGYIEIMKQLDIDLAGDFLVMAATLMQIKSAMLLPKADPEQVGEDEYIDPRSELIRQLLEYKKFKDAANLLDSAAVEQQQRYPRSSNIIQNLKPDTKPELDLDNVSIWDLLDAFDRIMKATGSYKDISLIKDDTPIDLYQIEILHRLQSDGPTSFARLFEGRPNRGVMIGLFLALLELIREKLIWVEQPEAKGAIYVKALTDVPAESAVQSAIISDNTGEQLEQETQATEPEDIEQIPIVELPAQSEAPVESETIIQDHQVIEQIPIVELPADKGKSTANEQDETRAVDEHSD
ncbi:MAG: segregation and condensation protein A [Planctomycetota bacterium]